MRSRNSARAGGRSSSDRTRHPVSMAPPSERRIETIASAIDCAPPRGNGQPTACASSESSSPAAADGSSIERHHGVAGHAGEEGASVVGLEPPAQPAGGARRRRRRNEWPPASSARGSQRTQQTAEQVLPGLERGSDQPPVGGAVDAQCRDRLFERSVQRERRARHRGDGRPAPAARSTRRRALRAAAC